MEKDIIICLRVLIEYEAQSCSLDFGSITSEYMTGMWGGMMPMKEIDKT